VVGWGITILGETCVQGLSLVSIGVVAGSVCIVDFIVLIIGRVSVLGIMLVGFWLWVFAAVVSLSIMA